METSAGTLLFFLASTSSSNGSKARIARKGWIIVLAEDWIVAGAEGRHEKHRVCECQVISLIVSQLAGGCWRSKKIRRKLKTEPPAHPLTRSDAFAFRNQLLHPANQAMLGHIDGQIARTQPSGKQPCQQCEACVFQFVCGFFILGRRRKKISA